MRKLLSDRASDELKKRAMRECEIFERDVRIRHQKEKEKHLDNQEDELLP